MTNMIEVERVRIFWASGGFLEGKPAKELEYRIPSDKEIRKLLEGILVMRYDSERTMTDRIQGNLWQGWDQHAASLGCRRFRGFEHSPNQDELEGLIVVTDPYFKMRFFGTGSQEMWLGIPDDLAVKTLLFSQFP